MTKLIIVANIHAAADKISRVKAELDKLVTMTHAEALCLQYDPILTLKP